MRAEQRLAARARARPRRWRTASEARAPGSQRKPHTGLPSARPQAYHLTTVDPALLRHALLVVPDKLSYDLCEAEGLRTYVDGAFPFWYWEKSPWFPEG